MSDMPPKELELRERTSEARAAPAAERKVVERARLLIEEALGEGPRKPFQVTDEGRAHLEERSDEINRLLERLSDMKPREDSMSGSPVWRAMRNLGMAIRNRLQHGDVTDETVHELAALIDEFAQRVERLK